jgi:RNA polymerase sigma-70 factor (sigma-E family)
LQDVVVEPTVQLDTTFDDLYARHYATMVRLARLTTGQIGLAEELVQDAFTELLRRRDEVRDPPAFLRRAVVSRSTSWLRRRLLERRHRAAEPAVAASAPAGDADTVAVRAALRRLTPRQRAAVFMRYYLDLPETDIAAALGCRPGTVKSLLHRSLVTLREYLDDH